MKKLIAAVITASLFALPAFAAAPVEVAKTIKASEPYGKGELSRLVITAYEASLWTDAEQWSYKAPFALSITYDMGFTKAELVDRTISEMVGQGEVATDDQTAYRAKLDKAFRDVKKGDRFTASYATNGTVSFYHNGAATTTIADATFAKRFFDIWLSEKTTEPSLRRALLKRS